MPHFSTFHGWCLGEVKVSCIFWHQGIQVVQPISAYSWTMPAVLAAGMGRGHVFISSLSFTFPLFSTGFFFFFFFLSSINSSFSFLPVSGR